MRTLERITGAKENAPHISNVVSINDLSPTDINFILNRAFEFSDALKQNKPLPKTLENKCIIALFAENSTRTRISFEAAVKRLGGEFILMTADGSSIKKGEDDIDTLQTLNAMCPDALIVRHRQIGFPDLAIKNVDCPVLNAGDGTNEHPTQALLDAMTLKQHYGDLKGMRITICGDIKHSRVAHSNVKLLSKLGAFVTVVAPDAMSENLDGADISHDFNDTLKNSDAVMMLRIQRERFSNDETLDLDSYIENYQLNRARLDIAPKHCMVLHPGPMNRDIEISSDIANDADRTLITTQVENGVYVRMACLDILLNS